MKIADTAHACVSKELCCLKEARLRHRACTRPFGYLKQLYIVTVGYPNMIP